MSAHIYLTDKPLGPYVGLMEISEPSGSGEYNLAYKGEVDIRLLMVLRQHIDNAIDALLHRQLVDAVCGDCEVCKNTRMATEERHGRPWSIHCPVCHPKILAHEEILSKGLESSRR